MLKDKKNFSLTPSEKANVELIIKRTASEVASGYCAQKNGEEKIAFSLSENKYIEEFLLQKEEFAYYLRCRHLHFSQMDQMYTYTFSEYLHRLNNKNHFINEFVRISAGWVNKPNYSNPHFSFDLPMGYDLPAVMSEAIIEMGNRGVNIIVNYKKKEKEEIMVATIISIAK